MKEEHLIFIVSQPRAGSTYLQNLLSNNAQVNTASEHWLLLNYANQIKPELLVGTFDNRLANRAFTDYIEKFNIDIVARQKAFLLNLYEPLCKDFDFVVDKTPRYWEIIDEISHLFPKSKIIVLKRDPEDVVKSIIRTWDIEDVNGLKAYRRDLLMAPKKLQAFCEAHFDNPMVYELKYEDLKAHTPQVVEQLYHWLNLEFSSQVLNTEGNTKFKGLYGDPFQNSDNYKATRAAAFSRVLSPDFTSFLNGYLAYLGNDFLESYGAYGKDISSQKKYRAFEDFVTNKGPANKDAFFKNILRKVKNKLLASAQKNSRKH